MKTDIIFYSLFEEFPNIFFELIGETNIDVNSYEFKAVELKETALRLDGVMLRVPKDPKQPIYFIEVQFQKNPKVYSNLFAKVFLYLEQNDSTQNWRCVVIYRRRSLEPTETEPYQALLSSRQVLRLYLDEIDSTTEPSLGIALIQLIVETEQRAANRAQQLVERIKQESTDEREREKLLYSMETILLYKFANLSREEVRAMLGVEDFKQTRLGRELLEEGREEGREEGLLEGEQIGRLKAKMEAVPAMLERGFTVEEVAEILQLGVEQVQQATQS